MDIFSTEEPTLFVIFRQRMELLSKPVVVSSICHKHYNAMESMTSLRSCTLTGHSIRMPRGLHPAGAHYKSPLSFTHSSLAIPKEVKRLSLSYNSSFSLPKTCKRRPIQGMLGPVICIGDSSLRLADNRDDKGGPNVAWASPFLSSVGWSRMSSLRGNASQRSGLPRASETALPGTHFSDHHLELMEVAKKLKESREYDVAVELLKLHEPNVKEEPDAAYHVKMEIMHILYLQGKHEEALNYSERFYKDKEIYAKRFRFELFYATKLMEMAQKLKESHNYDLAVKLLKVHDPEVEDDPDASYYVKMEIMHMLFLQGKYDEAWEYCEALYEKRAIYSQHFKSGLFYAIKSGILCGMKLHKEANVSMEIFIKNRSEALPLSPPDKDEADENQAPPTPVNMDETDKNQDPEAPVKKDETKQ